VIPSDQISLNFSKIEFEYKEQKADGTLAGAVKAGYDLKAYKKV
jgi:type VI secretion system secreted protein Hcp